MGEGAAPGVDQRTLESGRTGSRVAGQVIS